MELKSLFFYVFLYVTAFLQLDLERNGREEFLFFFNVRLSITSLMLIKKECTLN